MAKKTGKNLVIVESPAKAKTINKYLGDDYIVKASMGHVRDLPSKGMGVDLKTFEPEYEVLESRSKVINELKKLAKTASQVYLATDLDREGEAIAWHLQQALGIPDEQAQRVIFNAITKSEIQKAFKSPHKIDIDRVNAQQARRILDRVRSGRKDHARARGGVGFFIDQDEATGAAIGRVAIEEQRPGRSDADHSDLIHR